MPEGGGRSKPEFELMPSGGTSYSKIEQVLLWSKGKGKCGSEHLLQRRGSSPTSKIMTPMARTPRMETLTRGMIRQH